MEKIEKWSLFFSTCRPVFFRSFNKIRFFHIFPPDSLSACYGRYLRIFHRLLRAERIHATTSPLRLTACSRGDVKARGFDLVGSDFFRRNSCAHETDHSPSATKPCPIFLAKKIGGNVFLVKKIWGKKNEKKSKNLNASSILCVMILPTPPKTSGWKNKVTTLNFRWWYPDIFSMQKTRTL